MDDLGTSTADLRAHVCAGAALLDEHYPGWERKIDLSILDINDAATCVCGQVIPEGYVEGTMKHFGGDGFLEHGHGFLGGYHSDHWVALIKERFDSGNLSDN